MTHELPRAVKIRTTVGIICMLTKNHLGGTQNSICFVFKVAGNVTGQLYGIEVVHFFLIINWRREMYG